ncbi:ASCH domain-containing protein [Paenibacillus sp. J2TS4]|uniref:ASCH domain-containing protein n=1 Tax=Paenibacillus sp. J2TS4 TaxID=2807194 RepID=UPI001B09DE04|nr:ASCH domain-containing protein [Paenibacillus sp. J2TS4]GIP32687.1 hypothetical protein J2TS4_18970 [Paenibacillus sp. J2TS4]
MSMTLPPKTCSVERLVTVKEDIQKVLSGNKSAQRRNGRYADPGEIMELDGRSYEVYNIYRQSLGDLTDAEAQAEGFENVEAYKQYILSMHKGMSWMPEMKVWVHEFRPVP